MTLTSKAKLLVLMVRPKKYLQTLTILVRGPFNRILAPWPTGQALSRPIMTRVLGHEVGFSWNDLHFKSKVISLNVYTQDLS